MTEIIDFIKAKDIAEINLKETLTRCSIDYSIEVLSEYYLDKEFCFIFFRNSKITIPDKFLLSADWAPAVCKRTGEVQQIYDLRHNPIRMEEYSELMSEFFENNRLPTKQLSKKMEMHLTKYNDK